MINKTYLKWLRGAHEQWVRSIDGFIIPHSPHFHKSEKTNIHKQSPPAQILCGRALFVF